MRKLPFTVACKHVGRVFKGADEVLTPWERLARTLVAAISRAKRGYPTWYARSSPLARSPRYRDTVWNMARTASSEVP